MEMEWVSCTDRMPPTYETCIVGRPDVPWPITAFWTGEKWCRDVMKEEFHVLCTEGEMELRKLIEAGLQVEGMDGLVGPGVCGTFGDTECDL